MSATWGCLSVMGLCALLLAAGRAAWLLAIALRTHRALWGGRPRAVSPLLRASGDWAEALATIVYSRLDGGSLSPCECVVWT
ncbi:unnamed protein product [Lampetra fluviatilis]